MHERDRKVTRGFKHGYMRLLEHDKQTSQSSTGSVYYPRVSYIDDPTLEINQLTHTQLFERDDFDDDQEVERSISTN